jgi:hypothetical protein
VGNLLSLYPKIHRLRADSKEDGSLLNGERDFVCNTSGGLDAPAADIEGEALRIHAFLYGLLWFFSNGPACELQQCLCKALNGVETQSFKIRENGSDLKRGLTSRRVRKFQARSTAPSLHRHDRR